MLVRKSYVKLTDENIHGLGGGADNHADNDERSTNDGYISTADQVG